MAKETRLLSFVEYKCRISDRVEEPMDVLLDERFSARLVVSGEIRSGLPCDPHVYSMIAFLKDVVSDLQKMNETVLPVFHVDCCSAMEGTCTSSNTTSTIGRSSWM